MKGLKKHIIKLLLLLYYIKKLHRFLTSLSRKDLVRREGFNSLF